ncbi:Sau3AI family type II restriction endonuclease [Eubacterium sp.]|uniref:Sau3AI family type II restriction endonuclease n=1 Tax=Eubacterium sp. TaxID=142586 RepID=UPI0035217716
MDYLKLYDETNPKSIEDYSQKLIGLSFEDVIKMDTDSIISEDLDTYAISHEDKKRKGGLGELIEECFFHYECNSDSQPDFDKAGCELKVTPYKQNKNGSYSAKERLVITMINYMDVVNETFETSHLWNKSKLILLIYYLWQPNVDRLQYKINYSKLFTPPEQDIKIIRNDFNIILNKIKKGLAHELSGSDTMYLEACPKASNSSVRRIQPFSDIPAKPRAFAFKNSYMTYVLNNFIIPGKNTYEPIVSETSEKSFEEYVIDKVSKYKDYSEKELCDLFNIDLNKRPKNLGAMLAYRILGIKGNKAEEFEKAGIVVKTIRIENNNKIKENMSFPTFKFKKLIEETWEDSTFCNYLANTKFFFIVYKYDENNVLRLKGCQFWNIPYNDLNGNVKDVWEETVRVLKEGLIIKEVNGRLTNNFPKASNNPISHVRPHAKDKNDTYELPDGSSYPKQCFWLNNSYILSQLNKDFLD